MGLPLNLRLQGLAIATKVDVQVIRQLAVLMALARQLLSQNHLHHPDSAIAVKVDAQKTLQLAVQTAPALELCSRVVDSELSCCSMQVTFNVEVSRRTRHMWCRSDH